MSELVDSIRLDVIYINIQLRRNIVISSPQFSISIKLDVSLFLIMIILRI